MTGPEANPLTRLHFRWKFRLAQPAIWTTHWLRLIPMTCRGSLRTAATLTESGFGDTALSLAGQIDESESVIVAAVLSERERRTGASFLDHLRVVMPSIRDRLPRASPLLCRFSDVAPGKVQGGRMMM